jgi:predicted alpha/beta hydrolase
VDPLDRSDRSNRAAAQAAPQAPAAGVAAQPHRLRCADGRELAARWFAAPRRRAALVISAGTGFPQQFYFKLAAFSAARGYDTLVYDYRGMGESAPADLRRETTRMSDWGLLDMRAALAAAAERSQGAPLATLGHSIGGQFLGLLKNHALARAHVQVATSVGYWRWEHAPFRYLAWWFWRVHGPLMLALKGYVPTGGGWSGLPLPRGAYEEWKRWCLRTTHFGPDLATYLTDNVFAEIRAPVLSIAFEDDPIATRQTVEELRKFFPNAAYECRWYAPRDFAQGPIGHGGFFSARFGAALWRPTFDWLDEQLGIRT